MQTISGLRPFLEICNESGEKYAGHRRNSGVRKRSSTSTESSPWFIVPADDKENARLIISRVVLDTFNALKMRYPETDPNRRQELLSIRSQLMKEGSSNI